MRIVVDTNVVISGTFFSGTPNVLINSIGESHFEVFANREIIEEYEENTSVSSLCYFLVLGKDMFKYRSSIFFPSFKHATDFYVPHQTLLPCAN